MWNLEQIAHVAVLWKIKSINYVKKHFPVTVSHPDFPSKHSIRETFIQRHDSRKKEMQNKRRRQNAEQFLHCDLRV